MSKMNKLLDISKKLFSSNKQIMCFKELYQPSTNKVCDCVDKCKYTPPSEEMEHIKFNLNYPSKYHNGLKVV